MIVCFPNHFEPTPEHQQSTHFLKAYVSRNLIHQRRALRQKDAHPGTITQLNCSLTIQYEIGLSQIPKLAQKLLNLYRAVCELQEN